MTERLTFEVDDALRSWSIHLHAPAPAGWMDIVIDDVLFRFNRCRAAELLMMRIDAAAGASRPSMRQVECAVSVIGESVRPWLATSHSPPKAIRVDAAAVSALGRIALAEAVRGHAEAWDHELIWLRTAFRVEGGPGLAAAVHGWLDADTDMTISLEPGQLGPIDDAVVAASAAVAAGAEACDAERFADIDAASAHWRVCAEAWRRAEALAPSGIPGLLSSTDLSENGKAAESVDVSARISSGVAGEIFLTEHRARLGPSLDFVIRRFDDRVRLSGAPSGPAGTTTIQLDGLVLTVDAAEPTRVVEMVLSTDLAQTELGAAITRSTEQVASMAHNALPAAVLARDVEVLSSQATTDVDFARVAGARYELAAELAAIGAVRAAGEVGRQADRTLESLEIDIPEAVRKLRSNLEDLLPGVLPRMSWREHTLSARLGASLGATLSAVEPLDVALDEFRSDIKLDPSRWTVPVLDDLLEPLGMDQGSEIQFQLLTGPVGKVTIDALPERGVVLGVLLLRDGRRVGETTVTVAGPTVVTLPITHMPDALLVDRIDGDGTRARQRGRQAVAAELLGKTAEARQVWLEAAQQHLAGDDPDRSAIAFARALQLDSGATDEELRRVALLGASWALTRGRVQPVARRKWQAVD